MVRLKKTAPTRPLEGIGRSCIDMQSFASHLQPESYISPPSEEQGRHGFLMCAILHD